MDEICLPLTIIFQKSLKSGKVPYEWKIANVTPIHKKDSRSHLSNYRSMILTSQVRKLVETIVLDAIVDHLERIRLINDSQHGFRRGHSANTSSHLSRQDHTCGGRWGGLRHNLFRLCQGLRYSVSLEMVY